MYFEQKTGKRKDYRTGSFLMFGSAHFLGFLLYAFLFYNSRIIHQRTSSGYTVSRSSSQTHSSGAFPIHSHQDSFSNLSGWGSKPGIQTGSKKQWKTFWSSGTKKPQKPRKPGERDTRRTLGVGFTPLLVLIVANSQTTSLMLTPILIWSRAGVQVFLAGCSGVIGGDWT